MNSTQSIQAMRVSVAAIRESPWNVNVMARTKYDQMKADMKTAGPEGTDPIDTCMINGERFVCDGSHRLRAAKELSFDHLYEIFHPEIQTEEQARLFNYRRDYERGDIDPFKLAESFKWFVDQGSSQKDVAKMFGVDETTVSKKLGLLRIDPEVKKQVVANSQLTVSHLEPLAVLSPQKQKEVVEKVQKEMHWNTVSVRDVEEDVQTAKREEEQEKRFKEALAKARPEFKKCPECKADPVRLSESYYARGKELVVEDDHYHRWSLVTGPLPKERSYSSGTSHKASVPQHVKSKVPTENYVDAIRAFFDRTWPRFKDVTSLTWSGDSSKKTGRSISIKAKGQKEFNAEVEGKLDGKPAELDISVWDFGEASVSLDSGKGKLDLTFKKFQTSNPEMKAYRTVITQHDRLTSYDAVRALKKTADDFLEEYGKVPKEEKPSARAAEKKQPGSSRKTRSTRGSKGSS